MHQRSVLKALLWVILVLPVKGFAQDSTFTSEFGFRSDNDAYLGTGQDRYYTNGLFITFRHAMKKGQPSGKVFKKTWEAEIGQRMYNALSGATSRIEQVDRPFAAYLYAGGKVNWFYSDEKVLQASLQAGTIGPSALGKDIQELLHRIVGFYKIDGWQFQVKDEFQVNTGLSYSQLIARSSNSKADIVFEGNAQAGTTFSGAAAGVLVRLGAANPLFSSVATNSRIGATADQKAPAKEFFFFLRPRLSLVAYDATVQGGLFRDDKGPVTFDVKPLVFSQELGAMFAHKRWTVNYSLTFLSRQVKSDAKPHQYGTVDLFYRFR